MSTSRTLARMKGMLISFFPTPMMKTLPPNLTDQTAAAMLLSTPVHSIATLGSTPPKLLTMAFAESSAESLSTLCVITRGQSSLANANRLSEISVMTMGEAPAAAQHCSVINPIGPAPQIRTGSPRRTSALCMPARATLRGSRRAPFSYDMFPIL